MTEVTLTKEQVALLRPLLPASGNEEEVCYSTKNMFEIKRQNTKSSAAQNYLLVSELLISSLKIPLVSFHIEYCEGVSEGSKPVGGSSLVEGCEPCEFKEIFRYRIIYNYNCASNFFSPYYFQAFQLCPQLVSARSQLRARLSLTLMNRRHFLKRSGKLASKERAEPSIW